MHFTFRVESWRSLAEALILRGHNMKCVEDLDTARACLDRVEMLERERDNNFTGRLPVAATLQSEYHRLTVSDGLPKNAYHLVPLDVFSLSGPILTRSTLLQLYECLPRLLSLFPRGPPMLSQPPGLSNFHGTETMEIADVMQGDLAYRVQAACINHMIFSNSHYPLIHKLKAAFNFMISSEWFAGNRNSDIEKMSVRHSLISPGHRSLQGREWLALYIQKHIY